MFAILLDLADQQYRLTDIIFGALLIFGAYKGFYKGLIIEFISTFVFVVAAYLIIQILITAFDYGGATLEVDWGRSIPFLLIVLLIMVVGILIQLLGKWLSRILSYTIFGTFDLIAGAVLGVAKYAFALGLGLTILNYVGLIGPTSELHNSILYRYIMDFFAWSVEVISTFAPSVEQVLQKTADTLSK